MGILSKRYLHTLASNVVLKFVIGLIIGIVTARALGPEGRGEYNLYVLAITLATTLLSFGISGSNTYFIASKQYNERQLFYASSFLAILLGILSLLLIVILNQLGWLSLILPFKKFNMTIVLSLCVIPIAFFNVFAQGILVGQQKIMLNNYLNVGIQGLLAVAFAALYFLDALDVTATVSFYALSQVALCILIVWTSWPAGLPTFAWSLGSHGYRRLLKFSSTLHLGNLTQFFNYRLDAYIVNYFLGTAAVGQYGISATLAETLWLISNSMATVLLPTLSSKHAQSKEIAVKAAVATFCLSLLGGIVAFFLGPLLIPILFGRQFADAILPFQILIPGIVVLSISNVLATYVTGIGKPGINAAIAFVSFLFTLFFDILLIPQYGIPGAATASTISYAVTTVLTIFYFARVSSINLQSWFNITRTMRSDVQSAQARAFALLKRSGGQRST